MRETSIKLHRRAIDKSVPLIEQLMIEGVDKSRIVQTLKRQVESKMITYYRKQNDPQSFGSGLSQLIDNLAGKSTDSNAEKVFYRLLFDAGITFNFHYKIGPYEADYFIPENLVVELDGPQHNKEHDEVRDKYMRNMGYRILRLPIWVVANDPDAVIKEIKNAVVL